jgi:excisionase family DNA binding protein
MMSDSKATFDPPSPLLTAADVAQFLNVDIRTIRRLIADEKLRAIRIGRAVRIRQEDVQKLIS